MTLDRDDRELDELIRGIRARFIARSDASFDFEAGLADVRERAGLPFALVPARRVPPGPGPLAASAALVFERIDELVTALGCLLLDGPLPELIGSQVQRAAEVLLRLCDELAAGSLTAAGAAAAIAAARDALGQADLVLRVELGTSLDDALAATGSSAGPGGARQSGAPEHEHLLRELEREIGEATGSNDRSSHEGSSPAHRRPAPRRTPGGQQHRRSNGGC